jgi:hypothetical protein
MEILIQTSDSLLSFDGRVLEAFNYASFHNWRFHIRQINSIALAPPDKHGKQMLSINTQVNGGFMFHKEVAPNQIGEAQKLVAAVMEALHSP